MPILAASLTTMFTEVPFLERFALAREAGFSWVEYPFPYGYPPFVLKRQLDHYDLRQAMFNLHCGDWGRGDRGIAADPGLVDEFRTMLPRGVEYALSLGVANLNCLAGKRVARYDDTRHMDTLVANVKFAARSLAAFGLRLMVETINSCDLPGYFLDRIEQALALLDMVDEPNVFLNLNLHPAQRENEYPLAILRNHLARIGHIQVGSRPGESPAWERVLEDLHLFEELDRLGYQGLLGLQQWPGPEPVLVESIYPANVSLGLSPGV